MASCREFTNSLADYFDKTLDHAKQRALSEHVQLCSQCQLEFESYRKTTVLCKSTLMQITGDNFSERLMLYLREKTSIQNLPPKS
jgi:hypothetical protein